MALIRILAFVLVFSVIFFDSWLPFDQSISQAAEVEAPRESYFVRPSILDVQAKEHPELKHQFEKLKKAHVALAVQMLMLYPDRELYFLARDAELLYDMVRLMGGSKVESRIHLLNVSRANMRDPNIKSYLAENGIDEESLRADKKVVFVDTGFSGTIPKAIQSYFPLELHGKLQTHLIVSANSDLPMSRSFLIHINPAANNIAPETMHGTIVSYEHIPRFTNRSDRYEKINGKWAPTSTTDYAVDGAVNKEVGLAYMEDLKHSWLNDREYRRYARNVKKAWEQLLKIANNASASPQQQTEALKSFLGNTEILTPDEREAMVRDAFDVWKNQVGQGLLHVKLADLGLKAVDRKAGNAKLDAIAKYPQWAGILEDPETEIPKQLEMGNFQTIGSIWDAVNDEEIRTLIARQLGRPPFTPGKKALLEAFVEGGDKSVLETILRRTFNQPESLVHREILIKILKKGDSNLNSVFVTYGLATLDFNESKDIVRMLIQSQDSEVQASLAASIFKKPEALKEKELALELIRSSGRTARMYFARIALRENSIPENKDLLRALIEVADANTLESIAHNVFSRPDAVEAMDLMELVIQKGSESVLSEMAMWAFKRPDAVKLKRVLNLLIEKGGERTLFMLGAHAFKLANVAQMKELYVQYLNKQTDPHAISRALGSTFERLEPQSPAVWSYIAENGTEIVRKALASTLKGTFLIAREIEREPKYKALLQAIEMDDAKTRKAALMSVRQSLGLRCEMVFAR